MGDLNHSSVCWMDNTAGHKQTRRFLECFDGNFSPQEMNRLMSRDTLLDLILTNKEELMRDIKVRGSLICSTLKMTVIQEPERREKGNSKITTLNFRRADLSIFRDLPGRIQYNIGLERRRGSSPPRSTMVHSNEQEVKQR